MSESAAILIEYINTLNRIQDYFEYRFESKKDKEFVYKELDKLTKRLAEVNV